MLLALAQVCAHLQLRMHVVQQQPVCMPSRPCVGQMLVCPRTMQENTMAAASAASGAQMAGNEAASVGSCAWE